MSSERTRGSFRTFAVGGVVLLGLAGKAGARAADASSPETVHWFQAEEQALMDSIARGDRSPWQRILDPSFVITSEEGEVMTKEQFLDGLRPLPPGLTGNIVVRDLTVQEFPDLAVVRFLADEQENVFGQRLATQYRITDTYRRAGRG
ncbi:MAG TPA: nuclear transport factor 2 family protein, partial [Thermoanaerobaculia bacterium]|nr:nuclear transport factor 2 family protein [Thermoanaerobaculia bacterium]